MFVETADRDKAYAPRCNSEKARPAASLNPEIWGERKQNYKFNQRSYRCAAVVVNEINSWSVRREKVAAVDLGDNGVGSLGKNAERKDGGKIRNDNKLF